MTFKLAGDRVLDTQKDNIGYIIGVVKGVYKRNSNQKLFIAANGEDSPKLLARALRARLFREKQPIAGWLQSTLNMLDPPRCRCGKPGTRIFARQTFCNACGPTSSQKERKVRRDIHFAEASDDIEQSRKERDDRDLASSALHNAWSNRK